MRALQRSPEDFRLHANYAGVSRSPARLEVCGCGPEKKCELIPGYYFPHYALGVDLKEAGEFGSARGVARSLCAQAR